MKKIISACIKQVVELDSEEEMYRYLGQLKAKKIDYHVIQHMETPNGKIHLTICKSYNSVPLLKN